MKFYYWTRSESESFRRRIFPHKWRKGKNILLIKLLGGKNPLSYDWNTQYSPKKYSQEIDIGVNENERISNKDRQGNNHKLGIAGKD